MEQFNEKLGNKLAFSLATMGCFYVVFFLVITPLFWQRPDTLVGWMQYIVAVFFQGVALPILAYDGARGFAKLMQLVTDIHDSLTNLIQDLHQERLEEMKKITELVELLHEKIDAKEDEK